MKTDGLQSFQSLQRSSLLQKREDLPVKTAELSNEEENMISKKFNRRTSPLEFYEGSGSVRREHPASKGSNLDLKI